MAMSNAERQRKFRQKRDQDLQRRQAYLDSEKRRYVKDKETGKKRSTKELGPRERRLLQRKWRKDKARLRKKAKEQLNSQMTPPQSPEVQQIPRPSVSRQRRQHLKESKRQKAACYRENAALRLQLEKANKQADMYKKRWHRERENKTDVNSPRTKTRKLLQKRSQKTVKRTLLFHNAMMNEMSSWYKNKSKNNEKRLIATLLSGPILRKYKFKTEAWYACGIKGLKRKTSDRTSLSLRQYQGIKNFYERDDISRLLTGTRRTVTYKKQIKQRRILKDTLKHTFLKYQSEGGQVSFATFCRLRPFWVVFPRPSDRQTCLCKICENVQFMFSGLKSAGAIKSDSVDRLISTVACDPSSHSCMHGNCEICNSNKIDFDRSTEHKEIQWMQWRLRTEKRKMKVKGTEMEKDVTFTVKETQSGSVSELAAWLEKDVEKYKKHYYNIRNQIAYFKNRRESLKSNECVMQIDFSENYVCKHHEEVQSMHFGASKKQLSLHTGVYYVGKGKKPNTFCTVSENLNHGPGAIWAHLRPILKIISQEYPDVDSIEIFSDGPTAQYRQKGNFYQLTAKPIEFASVEESDVSGVRHDASVEESDVSGVRKECDMKSVTGNSDLSEPKQYVSKFVVINYNGTPFPGWAKDANDTHVLVECMHRVGRIEKNDFYWPRKLKDVEWYDYDNVIAVIPEPIPIQGSSHFQVSPKVWSEMIKLFNKM